MSPAPPSPPGETHWKAWGREGPLARDLVGGRIQVPEPTPPPRGVRVDRVEGGGLRVKIGSWPLSLSAVLENEVLILKGIFRGKRIPLEDLSEVREAPMGLLFKFGQGSFLFVLPDPEIRVWLKGVILRNLVTLLPSPAGRGRE